MRALLAYGDGELAAEIPATDEVVVLDELDAPLRERSPSRPSAPTLPQGRYASATIRSEGFPPGRGAPVGPTPRVPTA